MNNYLYEELLHLFQNEASSALPTLAPLEISKILDYDTVKNQLKLVAVKRENDAKHLKDVPNRDYLDLSIICKIHVPYNKEASFSIPVTTTLLNTWNITEKELFSRSLANTLNATWNFRLLDESTEIPIFCISNSDTLEGGIAILLPQCFEDFIELFRLPNDQYYVFAISIHKIYFIPKTSNIDPVRLQNLVKSVPATLSNSLYLYDHPTKMITIFSENCS